MTEEKTYNVYAFIGQYDYHGKVHEFSLKNKIKDCFYQHYTTKDLWEGNALNNPFFEKVYWGNSFDTTMVYLKDKIAEGKTVIFPVSSVIYLDEVKNYLDMGFTVWFMKAKDFRDFKKDYKEVM